MKTFIVPILLLTTLAAYLVHADPASPAPASDAKHTLLPIEPTEADMARSREVLKKWEGEQPNKAPRVMRVVYWTPADRDPQPEYRPRLTRVLQSIQQFYKREMGKWGFPNRSIQLDMEKDGLMKIYVAKGKLKSADCSESDGADGQEIRRDALTVLKESGIDGNNETMVIFCNLAEWDPVKRTMSHHSPYYASGDSRHGTAWQVDSPLLDSNFLAVKDQHLDDRQYGHISLGKYNSIFVGGACHELGHALGLPHCKACAAVSAVRGTPLMGSGNRTYGEDLRGESKGSFLSLAHALKLAAHPQFSGSVKQIETEAKAAFTDWKLEAGNDGLKVSGSVTANLPMHAVIAYADPAGGNDYDSEIAADIPTSDGKFTLLLPRPEKKNCTATLHFVALCANGAATASVWSSQAFTMSCRIDANSGYDISRTMERLEMPTLIESAKKGMLAPEKLATLSPTAQEAFRRLKRPDSTKVKFSPADVAAETKSIPLSDTAPASASTGWGGVHFDRTPEGGPLVGAADGLFAHGLYAHANAEHVYALNGKWDSLSGVCSILEKGYGAVEGTIVADDKVIWQSGLLKQGTAKPFSVNLKGVNNLKLQINAKKGNNGAWAAWGEPVLKRG